MVRKPASTRPRSVTYTGYLVFIVGGINGWRVWVLSQQGAYLAAFAPTLDPRVRLVVSLVILVASMWLAAALWRRKPFTRQAIPLFLLLCALYRLTLLALWVQSPVARQGWVGEMVLYAAAILFTLWALNRRAAVPYFSQQSPIS
jgi:hypothetical protein